MRMFLTCISLQLVIVIARVKGAARPFLKGTMREGRGGTSNPGRTGGTVRSTAECRLTAGWCIDGADETQGILDPGPSNAKDFGCDDFGRNAKDFDRGC